jgi:hypothetical protein
VEPGSDANKKQRLPEKDKHCVSFLHKSKFPDTTLASQFISGNES